MNAEPLSVRFAITLTQPWASLMAYGVKTVETRSRRTRYIGWIAIHAAKNFPEECRQLCYQEPFLTALKDCDRPLPIGAVVAVTRIIGCTPTANFTRISETERAFGDYGARRYGYITHGVRRLREPIPMRGSQTIPWVMPRVITEEDLI